MKRLLMLPCVFVLLLALGGWGIAGASQNPDQGSDSEKALKKQPKKKPFKCLGPVNMSNGTVLPPGKIATVLKYRYVHKDSLYDGESQKKGHYNGKRNRVNQIFQLTVKAGLFKNFEARVMAPFFIKKLKRNSGNPTHHTDTDLLSGLGDMVFMGRYALLNQRSGDWCTLSVGAGAKMPTGDPDNENPAPFSKKHKYMGPAGQLGTGSWDPKFELGATKFVGRSRFDTHFMYTIPGDGAHGSRRGKEFKYNFAYGYALSKYFDAELELNGVDMESDIYDGSDTDNTGGHTIFITPGVHFKITRWSHFSVGVPIVIYRNINGESGTPDVNSTYGLGEDFQVIARLGFVF